MGTAKIRKPLLLLFGWWLLGGGSCTLAVGVGFGFYTSIFMLRSTTANGTVVRFVAQTDDEGTTNYAPVFSFTATSGQVYTVRSGVATNPPGFDEGQSVRVRYIKSDPSNAKLDSFWQLWTITVICCPLGLFFSCPGYLLLRYRWKRIRIARSFDAAFPTFTEPKFNPQA